VANSLLHCGISAPSNRLVMSQMGHKQR